MLYLYSVLYLFLWRYLLFQVSASTYEVCNTPGCIEAANIVRKNMDVNVDPCKNFYKFACGEYLKREKVDKDKTQASAFVTVDQIVQKQLVSMLRDPPPPREPKPFQMARNLYNTCLRKDLIEERGVGFLVDITRKVGGWPVLEGKDWSENTFNWLETVYKLDELGLGGQLFDLSVGVDLGDSFKRVLEIDQVDFGLSREYLIKGREDKMVRAYYSYMTDIAHLLGANYDTAKEELSNALDFEIELAKIAMSNEERRDISRLYNPIKVEELQDDFPFVQWEEYITKFMYNKASLLKGEIIILNAPKYLGELGRLIYKTKKRTLANYILWRGVKGTLGLLTEAIRDRQQKYIKILTGVKKRVPRWEECLDLTIDSLSLALGAWYVRHFFNDDAKTNAVDMLERIRTEMVRVLKEVTWMDEVTRQKAIDKALAMGKHIGYPSELLDDRKLDEVYSGLEITGDKLFESCTNVSRFGWFHSLGELRKPVNKTDWRYHGFVAVINAFYNPTENSVDFPAGILQNVFFSNDRPRYMNYGGIGFIMGHEITHGFDDEGSQFDKLGNLGYWWKIETNKEFKNRMQCFIDVANNYTVESVNMTLNGVNTQGENCADSAGSKLSYNAYRSWVRENHEEPRLPGLEMYTPRQIFWLSAANVWCTVYREPALRLQITTGYHAPSEYRINGAFSNQESFAQDFNCPLGSEMNPVDKCHVW